MLKNTQENFNNLSGFINSERGQDREFITINDLLSYGIDNNIAHIHVVPEEKVENAWAKFRSGLEALAEIIKNNENITLVTATSYLVAEHPKIIQRFGFTVDGPITEEMREKYFAGDKRDIYQAHMTREEFLKKYLKK